MGIEMKLQMRLSQQLIMTPQLQQAIKLLQLSRSELEELVDQALIENPVLEEGIDIDSDPVSPSSSENTENQESLTAPADQELFESAKSTEKERSAEEVDWQMYLEFGSPSYESSRRNSDEEPPSVEATLAQGKNLTDHLMWQLDMLEWSPLEHEIGAYIIGNINDDGYLTISVRELLDANPELHQLIEKWILKNPVSDADLSMSTLDFKYRVEKVKLSESLPEELPEFDMDSEDEESTEIPEPTIIMSHPISPEMVHVVENLVQQIQQFEPNGVGARSLQECLLIQLRALSLQNHLCYRIVERDMVALESKDLRKIARKHKEEVETIKEAWKLIVALEPKPGRAYHPASSHYIIPDVYIYKFNGEYKVALNESGLPRLRISNYYRSLADTMQVNKGNLDREYIQEKIKAGQWLMKSIEQRQKTIYRVTEGILKFQQEFFDKGINYLRPLVLKDIAEDIDVHESTVSRITTNKYVHTPQGIFELKYFFTSGIHQDDGEAVSSKRIKDMIQQLIQKEDAQTPYTDIQLAQILYENSSIRVARRTVAKYREALNILPSNKRKQLF